MKRAILWAMLAIAWPTLASATVRFVSKAGTSSNTNTGLTWTTAWATPTYASGAMSGGDTLVIGDGIWDQAMIQPKAGTFLKPTVYACSSWYANINDPVAQKSGRLYPSGDYRTTLMGGSRITGWTSYGTTPGGATIWQATWSPTLTMNGTGENFGSVPKTIGQGSIYEPESLLSIQTTVGNIDYPGEAFVSGTTIYACPYNNRNPNTEVGIFASCNAPIWFNPGSSNRLTHILIYGLDLKMGLQGVILMCTGTNGVSDSVWVKNCSMKLVGQSAGENPACFMSRQHEPYRNRWITLSGCEMSWAWIVENTNPAGPPPTNKSYTWGSSGGGACTYSTQDFMIDSCTIGPYVGSGVHLKNDDHDGSCDAATTFSNNVVRYSLIRGAAHAAVWIAVYPEHDSIYGNIAIGPSSEGFVYHDRAADACNNTSLYKFKIFVGNNTIVGFDGTWRPWTNLAGVVGDSNEFRYNVIYDGFAGSQRNWEFVDLNYMDSWWTVWSGGVRVSGIDNNLYYTTSGSFSWRRQPDINPGTSTNWQSTAGNQVLSTPGFDKNSTFTTNPNFYNTSDPNPWVGYARPSATSDMSKDYGGRHWTTYGAVQSRRVYYVSKNGSDAADGKSWATAWLSSSKAETGRAEGDTVVYGKGTWYHVRWSPSVNDVHVMCSSWFAGTTPAEKLSGKDLTTLSGGDPVGVPTMHQDLGGGTIIWKVPYTPTDCVPGAYAVFVIAQRDQMLVPQPQLSWLNKRGEAYHDWANNMLYYIPYAGGADTSGVICACNSPFRFDTPYIKNWYIAGLTIRHAHQGGILVTDNGDYVDSCVVEHCHIFQVGQDAGENAAAVMFRDNDLGWDKWPTPHPGGRKGWIIRADSVGENMNEADSDTGDPPNSGRYHGAIITLYDISNCVIESCFVYGLCYDGIMFKDDAWYSTMRYNTVTGVRSSALFTYWWPAHDSIYGNIVYDCTWGIHIDNGGYPPNIPGGVIAMNNTIYNVTSCLARSNTGGYPGDQFPNIVKYNAFSTWSGNAAIVKNYYRPDSAFVFDNNLWWNGASPFNARVGLTGENTVQWSGWQGYGYDLNGKNANPGFVNATAHDFTRSDPPPNEISVDYAGRHWSVMGAIQPGGGPPPYVRTNYYVSPGGNDLNVGSSTQPWLTMLKACTTANYNDTVFIYPGTYRSAAGWYAGDYDAGTMAINHSGQDASHPLVYRNVPGMARPVIEGQIAAATQDRHAATLSGSSYIVFDSLIFRNAAQGIWIDNGTDITIRNCVIDTVAAPDADTLVAGILIGPTATVTNLALVNDTIRYVRQRTTSPTYSYYDRVDDRAVLAKRSRNGNYVGLQVSDMGTGKGLDFTTSSALDSIYSCRIKNVGIGIAAQSCDTMRMYLNVISSFDSLGIRLAQNSANPNRDTRIYSNTIYAAGPTGGGVFLGFQNNTVNSNWTRPQIYDNIIVAGGAPTYRALAVYGSEVVDTVTSGIYTLYENYNLVYNSPGNDYYHYFTLSGSSYDLTGWKALVPNHGQYDLSADPLFVDAAGGDFRLMYASPARTASSTGGVMGALSAISSSTLYGTRSVTLKGVKKR